MLHVPTEGETSLYHYTNASAAIFGILKSRKLRLSPLSDTNDLWESSPTSPGLTLDEDEDPDHRGIADETWQSLDQLLRRHAKVACLTSGIERSESDYWPDTPQGWGHLAMWAHYGGRGSGICLRFNHAALIQSFDSSIRDAFHKDHREVTYSWARSALPSLILSEIRRNGADVESAAYAIRHAQTIFFQKHGDWSPEREYRLVALTDSALPAEFDISASLTGVFIGPDFSPGLLPALREVLAQYPQFVAGYPYSFFSHVRSANRSLTIMPPPGGPDVSKGIESSPDFLPRLRARLGSFD